MRRRDPRQGDEALNILYGKQPRLKRTPRSQAEPGEEPGGIEGDASSRQPGDGSSWVEDARLNLRRLAISSSRFWLGCFVVVLVLVHGFFPGAFKADAFTFGALVVLLVLALRPYLKSFSLPGGGGGVFREEVEAIQQKAELVEAISAGSAPVQKLGGGSALNLVIPASLREFASINPNAALAGLRVELEKVFAPLYRETYGGDRRRGLTRMIRQLAEDGHLDPFVASLALDIVAIGNSAAHAEPISAEQALAVFDAVERLQGAMASSGERPV